MLTHIYTLSCPDTGAIRYVGKANDLQARLRGHLSCAGRERTRKARWIRSLVRQGKRPTIESIDLVPDREWQFWEQHWVQVIGGCWGFDLTNGDAGGLGMGRCTPEMAKKIAMKLSGVPNLALSKPVFQYSASGEYLAEFKSVADGATSAGGSHANIVRAIKRRTLAYGSLWSYQRAANLERAVRPAPSAESIAKMAAAHRGKIVPLETRLKQRAARLGKPPANKGVKKSPELIALYRVTCPSRKAVEQVSGGAVIGIFGSVKEAASATGATRAGIIKCIAGTQAHAAGFQWRFALNNPVEIG
jgi:hypothetical protein